MIDIKRKVPRFSIKFIISSNEIEGSGINISQRGMGFLTDDEIIPAENIPFDTKIKGFIFSKRTYSIKGIGRLIYSIPDKHNKNIYYNGFEFLALDDESQENLYELINDIYQFQKQNIEHIDNKTLSDFMNYPSRNPLDKTNIFYNIIKKGKYHNLELFPFFIEKFNLKNAIFINRKTNKPESMIVLNNDDYLGLNHHPELIKTYSDAIKKYGIKNNTIINSGVYSIHKKLEEELAEFSNKQSSILFNSLYSANQGIKSSLLKHNDVIINDEFNHISLHSGNESAKFKSMVFSHNNIHNLEKILNRVTLKNNGIIIALSGIYNNSGDNALLDKIIKLLKKYNAKILIDESDSFGIIGKKGIGVAEHFNLLKKIDIFVSSLSKALSGSGAFVSGNKDVIEYLRYFANTYLYSTFIEPAMVEVILKVLKIIKNDNSFKNKLIYNISLFKNGLSTMNLKVNDFTSAIFPIFIPDIKLLYKVSKRIYDAGIFHNVFTYPVVPMGGSLLRFSVTALNTEKELNKSLFIINEALQKEGVI